MTLKFLDRLDDIIKKCIKSKLGEWIINGTEFIIYDVNKLSKLIKPYSINTLKRQLNYYDFSFHRALLKL